ncbi:hypothetical protein ACVWW4_005502 [Bradyrhizobium sp. LB7.1]
MVGGDRDANAGIGRDFLAVAVHGRAQRLQDLFGECRQFGLIVGAGLDDGEFVAAQPCDHVVAADAGAQPVRDLAQQLVADLVSERIVDALELVDVDIEDRERLALAEFRDAALQMAAHQHAVRQVGQRVVMRHVRDALVGADAIGDVVMGREPAAGGAGLVLDLDQAALRGLDDRALRLPGIAQDAVAIGIDVAVERAGVVAMLDHFAEMSAGLHDFGRQAVHLDVAPIADDQPFVLIEHQEALRHGVHRGVEPLLLHREPARHLAEDQIKREHEQADRQHGDGDEEFGLRAPGRQRRVERLGRDHDQRLAGQHARGDDAVLAVHRACELRGDERALEHRHLLGRSVAEILADHRVGMRNAREQLAVLMMHRDRGFLAEPARGEERFELVGRDRTRDYAVELAVRTGDAAREHDRGATAEPSGHDFDLFLRGRVVLEPVEIAAVTDRDVGDRPAPRRVDQNAVGIEHIGAGDIGPTTCLCAQHLVHGECCHLTAEDISGFDATAFEFRDDALLEHREVLELAVEMTGEQPD